MVEVDFCFDQESSAMSGLLLEMWTWSKMLKISWTEKVTNEEVLVCAVETRSMLEMIWHRKHRWLGHGNFLHDIIEGQGYTGWENDRVIA